MPQLANVFISSALRYAAAVLRSQKGRPNVSLLSILTEVNDDAGGIASWLVINPAAM
jgi:hypothetical protein